MINEWDRAIVLVDMNAFFASVEQKDHPELQGRAIGITNGATGTCIITCSYEARAYGIKTGMRVKEARQRHPGFIQIPARPQRYAQVSTAIMESLHTITPDIEIFSVDEAFLDVTRCQRLLGTPERIGQLAKDAVYDASGLLCSVGVSGDKTTAKWAAKLHKPDGLTVVPPWEAAERLKHIPVTDLCGIAKGIGDDFATRIAVLPPAYGGLGIVETAHRDDLDVLEVAKVHFALGEQLQLGRFLERIVARERPDVTFTGIL